MEDNKKAQIAKEWILKLAKGINPIDGSTIKDDDIVNNVHISRCLFYVALTRTKNRVYIVTPEQHPSKFVTELIEDYKHVKVNGKINSEDDTNPADTKRCPICGYPLQLRYKPHYGLKLWLCSNEPEICDFMTNDLRGGELSIMKCNKCQDGYLIVKEGKEEPFLGCTNYKHDKTGCGSYMTKEYYLKHIKENLK